MTMMSSEFPLNLFKPGDKVRLEDGDGRPHIISHMNVTEFKYSKYYEVIFEDNSARGCITYNLNTGEVYTDMIKL